MIMAPSRGKSIKWSARPLVMFACPSQPPAIDCPPALQSHSMSPSRAPPPPGPAFSLHLDPQVQYLLLDVGTAVATPQTSSSEDQLQRVEDFASHVTTLENWIDEMEDSLPKLTEFLLPGGTVAAGHLHVCRSVCRRAERALVEMLLQYPGSVRPEVQRYLNRLSDFFFTVARAANHRAGTSDVTRSQAAVLFDRDGD